MAVVTVADDVLTAQGEPSWDGLGRLEGWEGGTAFLISAPDGDHRALVAAVSRAAARFLRIDENGRELDEWELGGETYTPNYVSAPRIHSTGISLLADTKGFLSVQMGEAMVRTLAEELVKGGHPARVAAPSEDFDFREGELVAPEEESTAPPGPNTAPKADDATKRYWYVLRGVWATTKRGRLYQDVEYRRPDGTWDRDKSAAQRWPQAERDAISALVGELRTQENPEYRKKYGETNGVLLPADPAVHPWPLPPPHLRARDDEG